MKYLKYILIVLVLGLVVFFWYQSSKQKPVETPLPAPEENLNPETTEVPQGKSELCFAKFGKPDENGAYDKYTLRLLLDGDKATGELNLIPKDKDRKIGEFKGTVTAVDPKMMARTANLTWYTIAEGTNVKEQLKIIFGEGTASIGFGEMVLKGDVYSYKDPSKIFYNLDLTDVACSDLIERVNVETYLHENITELSPVKASLGGKWYMVYATIDLSKNSGFVVYEDGHNEQRRNFTYTTNAKHEVTDLTIK